MPQPFDLADQDQSDITPMPRRGIAQTASHWIDQMFAPVSEPLGHYSGRLAGALTGMVAPRYREPVERGVGEAMRQLPRTAAEVALTRGRGPLKLAGFGDVALRGYASMPPEAPLGAKLGAAGLQTAAFAAAPAAGSIGRAVAPKGFVGQRLGGAVGSIAPFEAANYATGAMVGQPYNPFTAEHAAGVAASVLPFEGAQMWYEHMQGRREQDTTTLTKQREYQPEAVAKPEPVRTQPAEAGGEGQEYPFLQSSVFPTGIVSHAARDPQSGRIFLKKGALESTKELDQALESDPFLRDRLEDGGMTATGRWISRKAYDLAAFQTKVGTYALKNKIEATSGESFFNTLLKQRQFDYSGERSYPDDVHERLTQLFKQYHAEDVASNLEPETQERVTSAAYKTVFGRVLTGLSHPEILKRLGINDLYPTRESRNTPEFGFVTNRGRFVSRSEAGEIAKASGQHLYPEIDAPQGQMMHSDQVALQPDSKVPMSAHAEDEPSFKASPEAIARLRDAMQAKGLGTLAVPLTAADKSLIERLHGSGWTDEDIINVAQAMKGLRREPGESWVRALTRKMFPKVGIDKPAGPQSLLRGTKSFFDYFLKDVLQMRDADADVLTQHALRIVARLGGADWEAHVVNAMGPGTAASYWWNAPSAGLPSPVMGLRAAPWTTDPVRSIAKLMQTLGHETVHGVERRALAKGDPLDKVTNAYYNMVDMTKDLTNAEMGESIDLVMRAMAGKTDRSKMMEYYKPRYEETADGRREYLTDFIGIMAMAAPEPVGSRPFETLREHLQFGEDNLRQFMFGMFTDLGKSINILDMIAKDAGYSAKTVQLVRKLHENFQELAVTQQKAEAQVELFLRSQYAKTATPATPIQSMPYDRIAQLARYANGVQFDDEVLDLVKRISPMILPQQQPTGQPVNAPKEIGIRLKPWDYFIALPQMPKYYPQLAPMTYMGRNFGTLAREFIGKVEDMFKDPLTNKLNVKQFVKVMTPGTATNTALGKLMLMENDLKKRMTGQEKAALPEYNKLSADDKAYVDEWLDHKQTAMNFSAMKWYDSLRNNLGFNLGQGLMSWDTSLKYNEAEHLGHAIATLALDNDIFQHTQQDIDPTWQMLWRNKQEAQNTVQQYASQHPHKMAAVTAVAATIDPKLLQKVEAYRTELLGPFSNQGGAWGFDGKPWYAPEVRLGKWFITHKPKAGEIQFESFKDDNTFKKRFNALNEKWVKGDLEFFEHHNRTDFEDIYAGMNPERFRTYNDVMQTHVAQVMKALQAGDPATAEQIMQTLAAQSRPGRAMQAMLESPHMRDERIGGREALNMPESFIHYIANQAYTMAKRYETRQQALYLNDPTMRPHPNLQKVARQYFSEIVDPTEHGGGSVFSAIKKLIAFNYIFFSPSLAFVELTQQATNHVPALVDAGMGLGGAYKAVAAANRDIANAWLKGKQMGLNYHVFDDPRDTEIIKRAMKDNLVDAGWLSEFWPATHDLDFINTKRMFDGKFKALDRNGYLGNAIHQLYRIGTKAHGLAITANTEMATLTAMRHFRSLGMSEDEAYQKTYQLVGESMHGGGRASRPLWFLGIGPGAPGANVGGLVYSLQMYVYNTVAQMARYLSSAIKNTAQNPLEISRAHKAAAGMLAAQLVLAGVGGLPVTNQALALIEQAFPGTEPRRRMREMFFGAGKWLNSNLHLVGQDEEFGRFLSTAATDGLAAASTPWNMSNRFELGILMGVDPYRGFDYRNLLGPGGPLLEQFLLKPTQAAAKGNYADAVTQMIPNANIRRAVALWHHGFDLRNTDEKLNLRLSRGEALSQILGFTPSRVAEYRQIDAMRRRAESSYALEQKKFHEMLATGVVDNTYTNSQIAHELVIHARENPGYNPREGARRIAELVQAQTLPNDPFRTGTPASRAYMIGAMFDPEVLQRQREVSEVNRLMQEHQLQGSFGFPAPIGVHEMQTAALVDQLMQQNPSMSRQEAQAMLTQVLHPRTAAYARWPY